MARHGLTEAENVGLFSHIIAFWSGKDTDFPAKRNKKENFVRRVPRIAYLCRPQMKMSINPIKQGKNYGNAYVVRMQDSI